MNSLIFLSILATSTNAPVPIVGFWERYEPFFIAMSALATLVLAIVASFQDRIRLCVYAPKLNVESGPLYPDSKLVPLTDRGGNICGNACCLGIPVKNGGYAPALQVEVFAARLEKEEGLSLHEVAGFYPLNLTWRHYQPPVIFLDRILRNTTRECAIGMIPSSGDGGPSSEANDPGKLCFQLALWSRPNTRCDLLTPGKYRLCLEIGAANARALTRKVVEFDFSGRWSDDPRQMIQARVV